MVKQVKFEVDDVCLVGHELLSIEVEEDTHVHGSSSSSSSSDGEFDCPVEKKEEVSHGPGKLSNFW